RTSYRSPSDTNAASAASSPATSARCPSTVSSPPGRSRQYTASPTISTSSTFSAPPSITPLTRAPLAICTTSSPLPMRMSPDTTAFPLRYTRSFPPPVDTATPLPPDTTTASISTTCSPLPPPTPTSSPCTLPSTSMTPLPPT